MTVDIAKLIEESQTGIGGSDCAALFGKSPWKTIHEVYISKIGLTKPETAPEPTIWQEIGLEMEPAIIKLFLKRRPGKTVIEHPPFDRSEKYPFMIGHLDGLIKNEKGLIEGVLEIKTSGWGKAGQWGLEGTDEVPENYNLQVHHYMALTGLRYAEIAVLMGGSDFKIFRVDRNEKLIEALVAQEKYFWETYVVPQVPPPIDGTEGATRMLRAIYPDSDDTVISASEELHKTVLKFFGKRDEVEVREAELLALKNEIIASMEESGVLTGQGYKITNKKTKASVKVDWSAIVSELSPKLEIIERFSKVKDGYRVFRPGKFKKEE